MKGMRSSDLGATINVVTSRPPLYIIMLIAVTSACGNLLTGGSDDDAVVAPPGILVDGGPDVSADTSGAFDDGAATADGSGATDSAVSPDGPNLDLDPGNCGAVGNVCKTKACT